MDIYLNKCQPLMCDLKYMDKKTDIIYLKGQFQKLYQSMWNIYENCKIYFFVIVFIFSFWSKNFKRSRCAKSRLLWIDRVEITCDRSSRSWMFFKTGDLKILFRNIHKKTPVLESLFNKVALKFFIKRVPRTVTFLWILQNL